MLHEQWAVAPLELKASPNAATGEFTGYGAVFGNVDAHGDMIVPGAFLASIAGRKGRPLPMHLNHGMPQLGGRRGVGVWSALTEDSKGLEVKGRISGMATDAGRLLYEQVKDGAFHGLSIGYRVPAGGAVPGAKSSGVRRTLKTLDLSEISLVDDPSNAEALILEVKTGKARTDSAGAASSIAAAMRLHNKAMGDSYSSNSPRDKAQLMEHLRDAHEALTGQRAPDGLDGWTKSGPSRDEVKAALINAGMTEELAAEFSERGFKTAPAQSESGLASAFAGFGHFKLT